MSKRRVPPMLAAKQERNESLQRAEATSWGTSGMLDFIQQLVGGIALGCVYGLIALGFVLIYKATEVVNFAQGDLMMLGGFFAYGFIGQLGFNYWVGFLFASSPWRRSAAWSNA